MDGKKINRDTALSIFSQIINRSTPGVTTRYGLESPGFELRWGQEIFPPHPSRSALQPTQTPVQCSPGFFPGCKADGAEL